MQQIAITQLTPQDLKQLIKEVIQQELSSLMKIPLAILK